MSNLEVVRGELQHVPQNVTDDLGLPLHNHGLVVQRLYDLWLHLKQKIRGWGSPCGSMWGDRYISGPLVDFYGPVTKQFIKVSVSGLQRRRVGIVHSQRSWFTAAGSVGRCWMREGMDRQRRERESVCAIVPVTASWAHVQNMNCK